MNKYELAAQIGFFLISKSIPSYGCWTGRLSADEQRKWFGLYLGKGTLHINGTEETIEMNVSVCFGTDSTTVFSLNAKTPNNSFVNDQRPQVRDAITQLFSN